ncbi:hypothetical protein ACJX0J_031993, partial [Zea mays]
AHQKALLSVKTINWQLFSNLIRTCIDLVFSKSFSNHFHFFITMWHYITIIALYYYMLDLVEEQQRHELSGYIIGKE